MIPPQAPSLKPQAAYSVRDFICDLRAGPYTSLGSYPKFFLMSDGEVFSFASAKREIWRICRAIRDNSTCGYRVTACDINWESEMYCADSGEVIECAYPQDPPCLPKDTEL